MVSKTAGEHRKDIYATFKEMIGREMTEAEHQKLKHQIQGYLLEHGARLVTAAAPTLPTRHLLICKKCAREESATGNAQLKSQRNRNFDKNASLEM